MARGDGSGPSGARAGGGGQGPWSYHPRQGFGGHGWRNRYSATGPHGWLRGGRPGRFSAPELAADPPEREQLRRQAELLESELRWVRARLDELDAGRTAAD